MFTIKLVVYFLTALLSIFFPSKEFPFLPFVMFFASFFIDFYEYRAYFLFAKTALHIQATIFGGCAFFFMLFFAAASMCFSLDIPTATSKESTVFRGASLVSDPKALLLVNTNIKYSIAACSIFMLVIAIMLALIANEILKKQHKKTHSTNHFLNSFDSNLFADVVKCTFG